tara:strand:- start:213 stop:836 length:624 start_codon:yes stop_codon:yes gene_type:complete
MAYLDNTSITVDAILTKKGREKLAAGQGLNITQFALADDEIDYGLYEPAHPKGSAFYDAAIKAIPVLEASPDETQVMRFKLVTLPKNTTRIPKVSFGVPNISVTQDEGEVALTPTTSPSGNTTAGYTIVLANKEAGSIIGTGTTTASGTAPVFLGDEVTTTAAVVTGRVFKFIPNPNLTQTIQTTITVYGNETGGSQTIPVTVTYVA